MAIHFNRARFLLNRPRETSTLVLTGGRTGTEALARFAAEFLYRTMWNKPTPEGMEKAYLDTIPVECGDEELHIHMQELGQQVYGTLGEDFKIWADRTLSIDDREIIIGLAGGTIVKWNL
jgi:hypothetical protein